MKSTTPKTQPKLKFLALFFHCITLTVVCQALWPFSSASAANANLFTFKDYSADYYLEKAEDGTSRLRVVEQFTASFPSSNQNHGITRVIPYTNQDGKNLTMKSDDYLEINVWHNGKEVRPYKVEGGDGYFTVYIGDSSEYVHGEQVYTLEYEFRNVITEFSENGKNWQELYWDTNGNDWTQTFKQVTATVHFEDTEIAQNYTDTAYCYVGRYGDSGQSRCKITATEDGVKFEAKNLSSRENLTFNLEFKEGTFAIPKQTYDYRLILGLIFLIFSGIAFTVVLVILAQQVADKRKYYKGLFVKPEYAPLKDLTVAEMTENYIGKGASGQRKVATMMELAVQGKIDLIKLESSSSHGKKKTLWQIQIKSLDLSPEQVIILKIIAGSDKPLSVGEKILITTRTADSTLIKLGTEYTTSTQEELRRQGYATSDAKKSKNGKLAAGKNPCNTFIVVLSCWMIACVVGCGFVFADIPSYRQVLGGTPLTVLLIILFVAIFIGSIYFTGKISPLYTHTEKGLEASRYMDGLKLYVKMAEQDRIKFLQSVDGADVSHEGVVKLYEKLLPYAVVFKLEKSWLKEMSKYYEYDDVSNPSWYIGVGAFSAIDFASAITSASSYISTTTAHSTTSNSSSGFSGGGGGGFSGGGGGGGGGGGW